MEKAELDKEIRDSGLKSTKSRCAILDILKQKKKPVSADEVYMELKSRDMSLNISTVYRTLEALTEKNLVKKLSITGESKALFELNTVGHRHYLVCLGCRKTMAIDGCPLESYEKELADETDFVIEGHKLDIYGYCPECQNKT